MAKKVMKEKRNKRKTGPHPSLIFGSLVLLILVVNATYREAVVIETIILLVLVVLIFLMLIVRYVISKRIIGCLESQHPEVFRALDNPVFYEAWDKHSYVANREYEKLGDDKMQKSIISFVRYSKVHMILSNIVGWAAILLVFFF